MAWYHVYQFGEVTSNMYPALRRKALPIIQFEITDDPARVLAVKLFTGPGQSMWFNRADIILYRSNSELQIMPDVKIKSNWFRRFLKSLKKI